MPIKFDWDISKAASNLRKHGVSFQEAQTIFGDERALSVYDDHHSDMEDRFITIGWSLFGNLLSVVHADFMDDEGVEVWWIISARRATKREANAYAKQAKNRG
jgi:hypothetical protein